MATDTKVKAPTWDIDSIFPGGSKSREFAGFLKGLEDDIKQSSITLESLPRELNDQTIPQWAEWILNFQAMGEKFHLAGAYTNCLVSQDVEDSEALKIEADLYGLYAQYGVQGTALESFAKNQPDDLWEKLINRDGLKEISFSLNESRDQARDKMDEEMEKLALELGVNGYQAWNTIYDKISGDMRVEIEEDGEKKTISLGQNANRMSDSNRDIRRDAFEKMESAWNTRADYAGMALNSLVGFRLTLYKKRGWDNYLKEALQNSRIENATLDAMWQAISDKGPGLKAYIDAKKKVLGIDKFCWYDQEAPLGKSVKKYSFEDASDFVITHIGSFSGEMGDFTRNAIEKRWVEAEDRPGKRGGAWCTSVPIKKESRVFMTFSPSYSSLETLAHELGHAYHGFVLKDRPKFARGYPMTLAETASIFNELRVGDAALEAADSYDEKLMLLDQKLQKGLTFFCNIHARFLFDSRFHEARRKGTVSREKLNELMTEAQKEAFFGMLDEREGLHPLFWCSKLHFYLAGVPFYNFPYTFGFLFANGVYDRAVKEGKAFADSYRNLLADTGIMTTEDVASKHLGVDLTKIDFWNSAVDRVLADVEPFVKLCEEG